VRKDVRGIPSDISRENADQIIGPCDSRGGKLKTRQKKGYLKMEEEKKQLRALLALVLTIHFSNAQHMGVAYPEIFERDFGIMADKKLVDVCAKFAQRYTVEKLHENLDGINPERLLGVEL